MEEQFRWYAIRVTYSREMKLKKYLDSINIQSFIPVHHIEVLKKGQKQKMITPIVHNLIFVYSNRQMLNEIKREVSFKIPMRYVMDKSTKSPIIVPEKDMNHFIAVCGTMDERLLFLTKIEPTLQQGILVKITGGVFAGVEGRVVRIKKDRRVMVAINGLMAVVTAFIDPLLLEAIEK